MKKEIKLKLKESNISYSIRKSKRAKRMRLAVYHDSSVVVTLPRGYTESIVEKFLIQKSDWLLNKIDFFSKVKDSSILKLNRGDYLRNKEKALNLISERAEYLNQAYGFKYNKISIKNQKTRWGSCSSKGNLNFNYKLLFLPEYLRDYIIVHELCHLQQFNHSSKFWDLVAQTFPNFKELKQELKLKNFIT